MEINFTSREMLVGEMLMGSVLMGNRSVSFVVCYFGDLLKSANMASVRHKTFISLRFVTAHFRRFLSHMRSFG